MEGQFPTMRSVGWIGDIELVWAIATSLCLVTGGVICGRTNTHLWVQVAKVVPIIGDLLRGGKQNLPQSQAVLRGAGDGIAFGHTRPAGRCWRCHVGGMTMHTRLSPHCSTPPKGESMRRFMCGICACFLSLSLGWSPIARADAVTDWNEIAAKAAVATCIDGFHESW